MTIILLSPTSSNYLMMTFIVKKKIKRSLANFTTIGCYGMVPRMKIWWASSWRVSLSNHQMQTTMEACLAKRSISLTKSTNLFSIAPSLNHGSIRVEEVFTFFFVRLPLVILQISQKIGKTRFIDLQKITTVSELWVSLAQISITQSLTLKDKSSLSDP